MTEPNFVLLYVADPVASARFYTDLLGKPAVENSANFAMFILDSGIKLGLWRTDDVEPAASLTGGGTELGFPFASLDQLEAKHADWSSRGLPIAQPPTRMDFGHTFVALDPDGHRLRAFVPMPM